MSKFGPLPILNLIIAMRELNLPIGVIRLRYLSEEQEAFLQRGMAASMLELVDEARKLEGKS